MTSCCVQYMLLVRTNERKELGFDAVSVYESFYVAALFLRNLFSVFVLALGLKSAIHIGHPSFYKPAKWLQSV